MVEQLEEEQGREVVGRQAEHPASSEAVEAVGSASTLLWTRRPGDPGFCEFRLGLGMLPSRNTLKLPELGRSRAEAWLEASRRSRAWAPSSPSPWSPNRLRSGAIGISGPRQRALEAARAVVVQAVALHSPGRPRRRGGRFAGHAPATGTGSSGCRTPPHRTARSTPGTSPTPGRPACRCSPSSRSSSPAASRPASWTTTPPVRCRASSSRRGCRPVARSSCSSSRTTPRSSAAGWSSSPSAAGATASSSSGCRRPPRPCPRPAAPSSSRARSRATPSSATSARRSCGCRSTPTTWRRPRSSG